MFGCDQKIAGQRELEASPERDALHHRHSWNLQHLYGAIGDVHLRNKGSEPVDIFSRPFAHFAAEAEMRPFGSNHKHTYVAFAGPMHGYPQGFRETQVQPVEGWIGQHNTTDGAVSFKSDCHATFPPLYQRSGRTMIRGFR